MTTASLLERRRDRLNAQELAALLEAQKSNLMLLRDAGVTMVIGSDEPRATSTYEFDYLRILNLFTNVELLRMWSTDCVMSLFPGRQVGRLQPGQEASFLVLDDDPSANLDAVKHISLRVKQGRVLDLPVVEPEP